jgi:hypothetical protein
MIAKECAHPFLQGGGGGGARAILYNVNNLPESVKALGILLELASARLKGQNVVHISMLNLFHTGKGRLNPVLEKIF